MTIPQLYEYLESSEFQNIEEGVIFYNYYIYQYPAKDEYKIREQIHTFKESLRRSPNYLNVMLLDLFEAFCGFLKEKKFGSETYFDDYLETDKTEPDTVTKELIYNANSDEFINYVNGLINAHMGTEDGLNKPYVFVYGVGKMFPYLRTNVFLTKYEPYNDTSRYKIILFYPGHQKGNSFSLFDTLDDTHTYRATILVVNR